jgi:hypothetical protein
MAPLVVCSPNCWSRVDNHVFVPLYTVAKKMSDPFGFDGDSPGSDPGVTESPGSAGHRQDTQSVSVAVRIRPVNAEERARGGAMSWTVKTVLGQGGEVGG